MSRGLEEKKFPEDNSGQTSGKRESRYRTEKIICENRCDAVIAFGLSPLLSGAGVGTRADSSPRPQKPFSFPGWFVFITFPESPGFVSLLGTR